MKTKRKSQIKPADDVEMSTPIRHVAYMGAGQLTVECSKKADVEVFRDGVLIDDRSAKESNFTIDEPGLIEVVVTGSKLTWCNIEHEP